jgi:hypothetical protein
LHIPSSFFCAVFVNGSFGSAQQELGIAGMAGSEGILSDVSNSLEVPFS